MGLYALNLGRMLYGPALLRRIDGGAGLLFLVPFGFLGFLDDGTISFS